MAILEYWVGLKIFNIYCHASFTLSKERPSTYMSFSIYKYILELSLAITNFLKKNVLVISSIIRKTMISEDAKEPIIRPTIRLIIEPKTRLAIRPKIRLAMKLVTKPEGMEKFLTGSVTRPTGSKALSPSWIDICHNH